MTRDILLIRHGQTDYNAARRIQGLLPVPLNDTGRDQIRALARQLDAAFSPDEVALWSSPQVRALQSAELIQEGLGLDALQIHDALHEFDLGAWSDQLRADLQTHPLWPEYLRDPGAITFPEGESMPDIRARARRALDAILAAEPARPVLLIVTHGGIVRVLTLMLLGLPSAVHHRLSVANASATRLRLRPGAPARLLTFSSTAAHAPAPS